jgi:ribosomal protein S18 acetylase RimI-like enzyme
MALQNNKITLRNAQSGEFKLVSRLLVAAYQQYEKSMPPDSWIWYRNDMSDVQSRMADSELIIAEIDNHIAGAVTLYPQGADNGWPEGWAGIRLLAVHPDYRGQGIGRALMEECIRRCRERGTKTLGLHTTELMKVAREMYERMGFKRTPEFDFHPTPDNVVYAYRLDL